MLARINNHYFYQNRNSKISINYLIHQIQLSQSSMARHHRANSDLAGLKTIHSLKNDHTRELEQFGRVNRSFTNYGSFTATRKNKQAKTNKKVMGSPLRKIQINQIVTDTHRLAKYFYENDSIGYYDRLKKYLKGEWQGQKKQLSEHLNKLPYLEQSMQKKTYAEIQAEIIGQWRKSTLLYCIRSFWYEIMLGAVFDELQAFMKNYIVFRDFTGQLAYLFFQGCFEVLEKKNNLNILDKLTDQTANFIITSTNTWKKIFDKIVLPLFTKKLQVIPKCYRLLRKFDLSTLEINQQVLDISSKNPQMLETIDKIEKFIYEIRLYDKIKLLIEIRETMEQQIRNNQQRLIDQGKINKFKLLDKDDFISCLIYCVVKGEINFESLGLHTRYFMEFFGESTSQILSKFGCDSYLTDLEVVHDYLHQWAIQKKDLNDICVLEPETPLILKKEKKMQSNKTADSSGKKSFEDSPLIFCQDKNKFTRQGNIFTGDIQQDLPKIKAYHSSKMIAVQQDEKKFDTNSPTMKFIPNNQNNSHQINCENIFLTETSKVKFSKKLLYDTPV